MTRQSEISVSHSGRQHVHRLLEGLLSYNYKLVFYTTIWFIRSPFIISLLPTSVKRRIHQHLRKRTFAFSRQIYLKRNWHYGLLKEIKLGLAKNTVEREEIQFWFEKRHDSTVARRMRRDSSAIIIGYEISSAQTFSAAKKAKKICVLDLAQIHYKAIMEIACKYQPMEDLLEVSFLDELNARKQQEYELSDYIIVLSEFARQSCISHGIAAEKIFKVDLGFSPELFRPKKEYFQQKTLRLLFCGTLTERKGISLLLNVVSKLNRQGLHIFITFVGTLADAKGALDHYKSENFFEIISFLQHEELVKYYQQADVFVLPSYLDSWGMVVLEAMACGTPVIVTENTGSKEVVAKGGGWIVPAGSELALEHTILKFYEQRPMIEVMGRRAAKIAAMYTWDNYYKQIANVVETIQKKMALR